MCPWFLDASFVDSVEYVSPVSVHDSSLSPPSFHHHSDASSSSLLLTSDCNISVAVSSLPSSVVVPTPDQYGSTATATSTNRIQRLVNAISGTVDETNRLLDQQFPDTAESSCHQSDVDDDFSHYDNNDRGDNYDDADDDVVRRRHDFRDNQLHANVLSDDIQDDVEQFYDTNQETIRLQRRGDADCQRPTVLAPRLQR